jgi:hypothetical protein
MATSISILLVSHDADLPEDIEEIKDSLEVKEQKENTVEKAMDTET